jgi:hypothetical protein
MYANVPLADVKLHKHFGITFNEKLTWSDHIHSTLAKVGKMKDVMLLLKHRLSRRTLDCIYKVFVRPKLEYGSIIWANCTDYERKSLEKCQKEFARIVSGARKGTSTVKLYEELNWPSLEERRNNSTLLFMHKLYYNESPDYLSALLPTQTDSSYNLRKRDVIPQVRARTEKHRKSLIPHGIRLWNQLPSSIQSIENIRDFKKAVCKSKPGKELYNVGSRRLQVLHAQLRMGCSVLAKHLCDIHVKESPLCYACNKVEDCKHFFLDCKLYISARTKLRNDLSVMGSLHVDILLYGDPYLSLKENTSIFVAVHEYIINTGRFDT